MKILITGTAGFIGFHLAQKLNLTVYDHSKNNRAKIYTRDIFNSNSEY